MNAEGGMPDTSGWRLHRARILRGWTVDELARRAGVGMFAVMAAESDAWTVSLEFLDRVAATLGIDTARLLPDSALDGQESSAAAHGASEEAKDTVSRWLDEDYADDVSAANPSREGSKNAAPKFWEI